MTAITQQQLLRARELANILHTYYRHVWRMEAAGKLPKPVSIGGSKRFFMLHIKLFLECGCDMDAYKARKESNNAR